MIRKFSRRSGYQNIKKILGSMLTLLLIVQIFSAGGLGVTNVFAAPDEHADEHADEHISEHVNICHWAQEDGKYVALSPSANALDGHDNHEHDYFPGELAAEVTFNDQWCLENAPAVTPTVPETGSLTVTKVVSGGTKEVSDFPLFVNGMSITSGVASTSIVVGDYTVTETGDADYTASFTGDCDAEGHVSVVEDGSAHCTITNTFNGGIGGSGEGDTFKVKILKYVGGSQATADSVDGASFPFHASWDWTDTNGHQNSSGNFNIDQNGGIGGAPAYQAWTSDMTGPADYAVNEITTTEDSGSNVLPTDAQCVEGKYRLQGYKTGATLSDAEDASLSLTAPSFTDISSEQFVIVYNEKCGDTTPDTHTGNLHATKIVCPAETDLPNWSGSDMTIGANTATDFIATHPQCHLEPNWQFQAAYRSADNLIIGNDPGGAFLGEAGSPWVTLSGSTNASGTISTTFNSDEVWHIFVREVLKDGYMPFAAPENTDSNISAEMYCDNDVLNYDNIERVDGPFTNGQQIYCVAFNVPTHTGTTTGTILVRKVVINDNGGTGTTTNFSFSLDNGSSTAFEADGENMLTVATGTHNIVETSAAGYTTTYDGCANISVAAGQTQICTITNNDIAQGTTGNIIVNKVVINNNTGTNIASDFPLFVGSTSVTMGATSTLPLGTYTVSETFNSNLYAQSFSGDCDSTGSVTLSATSTKVCTITNHDIPQLCPVTDGMIVSDTSTMVGTANAALLSFVHPAWTADVDGTSTAAMWIWSTNPVATTTATTTVTFTRDFTVNGSSTEATLNLAADNTYRVWINGNLVGESTSGDNFTSSSQDSYDVSNFLVDGTNTLTIEVTNLPTPDVTDPNGNPAGLLYSLSWTANDCPSIGGGGEIGGQGGDNNIEDTTTTTHHTNRSRTIINANNNNEDDNTGTVLGISTTNPNTPLGQVLGIASTLPGLPNTGMGAVDNSQPNSTSGLAVIIVSLLVLSGVYLLQFRLLRRR